MPYKQLHQFKMAGLPDGVSFQNPSTYGKEVCESILMRKDLLRLEHEDQR